MVYALIHEAIYDHADKEYHFATWTSGKTVKAVEEKVEARYEEIYGGRVPDDFCFNDGEEVFPYGDFGCAGYHVIFFKTKEALTKALFKDRKF